MATIQRIRVPWIGGRGGAGISTFYALYASTALAPLRAFYFEMAQNVLTGISWQFEGSGDTIVAETGVLSGGWQATGQALVQATGSDAHAADASGFLVKWTTGAVLFGHRVVGRTFFVPASQDVFVGGTLDNLKPGVIGAAAQAMINAVPGNFVVWTRPVPATPSWTDVHGRLHPARAAHAGSFSPINGVSVPDKGVVLRSRRD